MNGLTADTNIGISSDAALSGKERKEDQLHRTGFVDTLTMLATSADELASLVISVEGAWGEGKTTVLNYLTEALERHSSKPIVLRFNPWLIKDTDNLIQVFFYQLSVRIGLVDNTAAAKSVGAQLLAYSSVFDVLRFIPGAEPWSTIVGRVLKRSGKAVHKIAALKELDLGKRRESVAKALENLRRRIVILVDDVDRVDADEVFEMLRLIKAVGDLPCITYVVALDPYYVDRALTEKGICGREQYLDKIVQIRMSLPRIDEDDLLAVLNSAFEAMPSAARSDYFKEGSERLSNLYLQGMRELLATPRDIKRLINRVLTIESKLRGEIQLADLLGLELLALKAQTVYQHIREQPEAYTGNQPGERIHVKSDKELVASYADSRRRALNPIPEGQRPQIERLVEFLFPLVNPKSSYVRGVGQLEANGRIAAASRLRMALTQEMPEDEFSLSVARNFLEDPASRDAILGGIGSTRRLLRFLSHLGNLQTNDQSLPDGVGYLCLLAELADSALGRKAEDERVGAFTPGPVIYVQHLCIVTLEGMMSEARELVIDRMLKSATTFTTVTWLIENILDEKPTNRSDSNRLRELFKGCDPRFNSWKAELVTKIANGVLNGQIFAASNGGYVIAALGRLNSEQASEVLKDIADRPDTLDMFMVALSGFGSDTVKGKFLFFSPEVLATYGGADVVKAVARQSLRKRTPSGLPALAYKALETGTRIYTVDGSSGGEMGHD